jgi:hypothetical protein
MRAHDPDVWTGGALQERIGEREAFWSRTNVSGLEVELHGLPAIMDMSAHSI